MTERHDRRERSESLDLSRRELLRHAGMAGGGALLFGLPAFLGGAVSPAAAALKTLRPQWSGLKLLLELNNTFAGVLTNVEGGGLFAETLVDLVGPDKVPRKRPGPVRYQDIEVEVPLGAVTPALATWLRAFMNGTSPIVNGAIVYANPDFTEIRRLSFANALLTQLTFPDFDAQEANEQASFTLRFTPQFTQVERGNGTRVTAATSAPPRLISPRNFRFKVDGIPVEALRRVSLSKPLVITQPVAAGTGSLSEKAVTQATPLGLSNMALQLPEADAGHFYAWFADTVLRSNATGRRSGSVEWLDPAMSTVLVSVQFGNLGIVRYEPDPVPKNPQQKRGGAVEVELFYDSAAFTVSGSVSAPTKG